MALSPALEEALSQGVQALECLAGQENFDPAVARALVAAGLHRTPIPVAEGGFGAGLGDSARVLCALGAVDGSAALGLAMHFHTLGAALDSSDWPLGLRARLWQSVIGEGALINLAATEAAGGSPARGAVPATTATRFGDSWLINGVKHWTTWLPALRYVVVTACIEVPELERRGQTARFLVDLETPGVVRLSAFDTLGMRGSASGTVHFSNVSVPDGQRIGQLDEGKYPAIREPGNAWFGICVGAVYLGIGEGARSEVLRWAAERRPGDGTTAVADLPLIRARIGRLHGDLQAARILLFDVARRWDSGTPPERQQMSGDIALAKLKTTQAAVAATDEALRIAGGPGFLCGKLERSFRDARAGLIHPPLEDLVYQRFAADLLEGRR